MFTVYLYLQYSTAYYMHYSMQFSVVCKVCKDSESSFSIGQV